jgi:hypothetical protein
MSKEMREQIDRVKNWKQFLNESNSNGPIKTYGDISKIIKSGKRVVVTNHYDNTRTYYMDDNGVPRDQHNQSKPSIFIGFDEENTVEIEPTSRVEIF